MKKEVFEEIILDFQERKLPELTEREISIPTNLNKTITITGVRRAGKTFLMFQTIKKLLEKVEKNQIMYINFEDERLLPLDYKDLNNLMDVYYQLFPQNINKKVYFFFDELQNIENWEIFIRRISDTKNVQIFISGSSSKLLSKEISTTLRGRTITYQLYPFSFREFLKIKNVKYTGSSSSKITIKNLLRKYLSIGGYPEIIDQNDLIRRKIIQEYLDVLTYRDLMERYKIRNIKVLKLFIKTNLQNYSKYFSVNKFYNFFVGQGISVSRNTLYEFAGYIEDAYFSFFLPKYEISLKKQEISPKKVYSVDLGFVDLVQSEIYKNYGRRAENTVFLELKRIMENNPKLSIFYYNDKNSEVDFVLKEGLKVKQLIQVCWNISDLETKKREIKGLLKAMDEFKLKKGLIITEDFEGEEKIGNQKIIYKPLWKWVLGV
ncbi:MAG: ATP-binding protein [Promethearchaeota archaeon]